MLSDALIWQKLAISMAFNMLSMYNQNYLLLGTSRSQADLYISYQYTPELLGSATQFS
jgi:hypothetical protein